MVKNDKQTADIKELKLKIEQIQEQNLCNNLSVAGCLKGTALCIFEKYVETIFM